MQNDLISRSALLKVLNKNSIFQKVTNAEGKNVIEIINEQPTAYSVEDVVERLEARHKFYENRFAEMSGTDRDLEDWGSIKSYKDAIDIVRKGGVDNATN